MQYFDMVRHPGGELIRHNLTDELSFMQSLAEHILTHATDAMPRATVAIDSSATGSELVGEGGVGTPEQPRGKAPRTSVAPWCGKQSSCRGGGGRPTS